MQLLISEDGFLYYVFSNFFSDLLLCGVTDMLVESWVFLRRFRIDWLILKHLEVLNYIY